MKLIFAFDTEDYVTPEAWDAQKWIADQLKARSLIGSFQIVGELARRLQAKDRFDVIEALGTHEIGYHGNLHSVPPIHPVAIEDMSLEEAISWIMERESPGVESVREVFGRDPVSCAMNGDSWTAAGIIAMVKMGMNVYAGAGSQLPPVRWFCGAALARYDMGFEGYFGEDGSEEEKFKNDFNRIAAEKGKDDALIIFMHPTRLATASFWDGPYYRSAEFPIEDLKPAPLRPEKEKKKLKDRVSRLIDWILERENIENCDMLSLYEHSRKPRELSGLLEECGLKPGEEGNLPLKEEPLSPDLEEFFQRFRYGWSIFPEEFTGKKVVNQAKQLSWTAVV